MTFTKTVVDKVWQKDKRFKIYIYPIFDLPTFDVSGVEFKIIYEF
jgi:hypothetical protein